MKIRCDFDPATLRVTMQSTVADDFEENPGYVFSAAIVQGECYVQEGAVTPVPPRPSPVHTWDWPTKSWVTSLADLQAAQWALIKADRALAEEGTFTWEGHVIQADKARIGGASTAALAAQTLNVPYVDVWTLADNTTIPVNAQDILSMGMALVQHVSSCYAKARALRVLIDNATTPEGVASITWDTPT